MINYRDYTEEDFLNDERFRKWILSRGTQESPFWENFQKEFPEKVNDLLLAKALFVSLHQLHLSPDKSTKEKIWTSLEDSITGIDLANKPNRLIWPNYLWWMAAAVLLIVVGLTWNSKLTYNSEPLEYSKQVSQASINLYEKINTTQKQQAISLKDGSKVKLNPGSKLSYSDFDAKQRIVYLDGEAYFDVAKDRSKPFIVYAGHIVVQVVGTSFKVTSNTGKAKSNVSVTSGKVKVYATIAKPGVLEKNNDNLEVYLSPNQQADFDANTNLFHKSLVAQPVQLAGSGDTREFYFTNTSIDGILNTLETAYGVRIRYDNTALESCKITAPLGDLPLFGKLDIICQTIGATYEVFGTEVVISGGNCNL
ncbi:FecR family protein [Dyadobacter sp. CY345]|uniref:FecR family protein n=1 Tax=Dyadobacter sp. CY345 TaxID=2909335 RepID=UPI001F388E22|nr:FecR family protein [Dyadobacter sp. CY345]MCF2443342.1 FecR family protein [Dyadobacter sp. CY345]